MSLVFVRMQYASNARASLRSRQAVRGGATRARLARWEMADQRRGDPIVLHTQMPEPLPEAPPPVEEPPPGEPVPTTPIPDRLSEPLERPI